MHTIMKNKEEISLALVVVSFNKSEVLQGFCQELVKQSDQNFRLIVVDNSDKEQESEKIRQLIEHSDFIFDTTYIKMLRNVGFGAACNEGASTARCLGATHVLFHNYDTYLDADYLSRMKAYLGNGEKIISPVILKEDGLTTEYRGGDIVDNMFVIVRNMQDLKVADMTEGTTDISCTSAPGCCLVMSLDVFESVGGFDPAFFVYFEDTDLCKRLRDAGERIHVHSDLRIRHAGSSTSGGTGSYVHYFLYSQGKRVYIRKHFGAPMFYLYSAVLFISGLRVALGKISFSQYLASLRGFATPPQC